MIKNIGILGAGKIGKSTFILYFMEAFNKKTRSPTSNTIELIEIDGFFETNKTLLSQLDVIILMVSYSSKYEANKIIDWYSEVKNVIETKPIIIIRSFKDSSLSDIDYKKFNNSLYQFYHYNNIEEFPYVEMNCKDVSMYKELVDRFINLVQL